MKIDPCYCSPSHFYYKTQYIPISIYPFKTASNIQIPSMNLLMTLHRFFETTFHSHIKKHQPSFFLQEKEQQKLYKRLSLKYLIVVFFFTEVCLDFTFSDTVSFSSRKLNRPY